MRAYKLLAMLTVCSLFSLQNAFAQTGDHQATVTVVQAELLPTQTLPIHVTMAKLQNFDTGSELLIDLKKVQDVPVSTVLIDVFVSHGNSIRRGEQIPVDLSKISPADMSFRLQTMAHLVSGDTALVFVSEVIGRDGNQQIALPDVISSVKSFAAGEFAGGALGALLPDRPANFLPDASLAPASLRYFKTSKNFYFEQIAPYCTAALQIAHDTCGNGIASFSCSPATQSFSFTCK